MQGGSQPPPLADTGRESAAGIANSGLGAPCSALTITPPRWADKHRPPSRARQRAGEGNSELPGYNSIHHRELTLDTEHSTELALTLDWQQITRLALRSHPFMLTVGLTVREALLADMALSGSPSQCRDAGVMFNLSPRGGARSAHHRALGSGAGAELGAGHRPLPGGA